MNQPSPAVAAPAPVAETPTTPQQPSTLEERAGNLITELNTEAESSEAPATEMPAAAAPDAAAQRAARLAELFAEDRARVEHKNRQALLEKAERAVETERKARADAEALASGRLDPSTMNEEGFFELAEKLNIAPEKLGAWLRDSMTNPEKIAQAAAVRAAKASVDPRIAHLEKQLADLTAAHQDTLTRQKQDAERSEEHRAAQEFFSFTEKNAADAPHSANFLKQHGPDEFYKLAYRASNEVPESAGYQGVLDFIEHNLARLFVGQPAPSQATASPPPPRATAPANTLTNSLASQRTSVVEGDDWSSLSLDERAAKIIASMG